MDLFCDVCDRFLKEWAGEQNWRQRFFKHVQGHYEKREKVRNKIKTDIIGYIDVITFHQMRGQYERALWAVEEINSLRSLFDRWEKVENLYERANYFPPYSQTQVIDLPKMGIFNLAIVELPD